MSWAAVRRLGPSGEVGGRLGVHWGCKQERRPDGSPGWWARRSYFRDEGKALGLRQLSGEGGPLHLAGLGTRQVTMSVTDSD